MSNFGFYVHLQISLRKQGTKAGKRPHYQLHQPCSTIHNTHTQSLSNLPAFTAHCASWSV